MDEAIRQLEDDDALAHYWQQKLADGASVDELVGYLDDQGFRSRKVRAVRVVHHASGLRLGDCAWAIDNGWDRRDAPHVCQRMRAAGQSEDAIRARLCQMALSEEEREAFIRACAQAPAGD